MKNKKSYDAFIFLASSDQNIQEIEDEMNTYRTKTNQPNSKLVFVNFTGTKFSKVVNNSSDEIQTSKNSLNINGWTFDSFALIDYFLSGKF